MTSEISAHTGSVSSIKIKELFLGILAVASSIAVFWLWHAAMPLVIEGRFQEYGTFIAPVGGTVVAATLFSLSALFVKNNWIVYPAVIVGIGVPYLFTQATSMVAGALAVSMLFIAWAVHRIQKEATLSLGFSVSKFLKAGLPVYFTLTSLVVSVYFLAHLDEEKALSTLLPKSVFGVALQSFSTPLRSLTGLPTISTEATLDDTIFGLVKEQLKSQGLNISQLPKKELAKILTREREELAKNFGIKLSGKEKISDVFYGAITGWIETLLGPYKRYLPLASALTFFLAFKALTFPLYYATLLITTLLIKFMISIKLLRREKQEIEIERLTL